MKLTIEQNAADFMRRTEEAQTFHIGPLEEVVVKVASERTNDTVCIVEHRSAPGAAPPRHLHQNEDEIFEILEGQFRFWLDGQMLEAAPGATVVAPRGIPHTWINVGGTPGRMSVTFIPGGLEKIFGEMENLPPTDPRVPQIAERYGVIVLGPPLEA